MTAVTVTRAPRAGESAGEPTARRRETERAAKATTGEKRKRNADISKNHFASEVSGTSAVIFGSTSPWYEAMVLASGAHSVVTIDYNRLSYQHPKIVTAIHSQILPLIPREHGGFDVAFSISSMQFCSAS